MPKDIVIRPVETKDYGEIAKFLAAMTGHVFTSDVWLDRFDCWWGKNHAMSADLHKGWVLCDGEKIGGFIGNIPVKYIIDGKEQLVCSATSWYVDPEFRGASMRLINAFKNQDVPLLDTTPIGTVVKILLRKGFKDLNCDWLQKDVIYPINLKAFFGFFVDKMADKRKALSLMRILSPLGQMAIKLFQSFGIRPQKNSYAAVQIAGFDQRYSQLWEKMKCTHRITAIRDSRTLNWFFFGSRQLRDARVVVEIKKGDALVGYIAAKKAINTAAGRQYSYLEVVDIFLLETGISDYYGILRSFLQFIKSTYRETTFIRMNAFDKNMEKALAKLNVFWLKGTSRFLHSKFPDIKIKDNGDSQFYATALDGDRCFFP